MTVAVGPATPLHTLRPTRDRSRQPHHSGTEGALTAIQPTLQLHQELPEALGR